MASGASPPNPWGALKAEVASLRDRCPECGHPELTNEETAALYARIERLTTALERIARNVRGCQCEGERCCGGCMYYVATTALKEGR